jgi:hypothetical protein
LISVLGILREKIDSRAKLVNNVNSQAGATCIDRPHLHLGDALQVFFAQLGTGHIDAAGEWKCTQPMCRRQRPFNLEALQGFAQHAAACCLLPAAAAAPTIF